MKNPHRDQYCGNKQQQSQLTVHEHTQSTRIKVIFN